MNKKQSLFHIAKRDTLPWYKAVLIRGGAIVLALIVCAIVTTLLTGENPIKVYSTILYGAFGTSRKSWVTFHNLAILLGISLAVTPAFKMRFWNIGAEGQVLAGGLAAAACMICLGDKVPNGLLIVLIVLSGIAAGAVWAVIPAIFKAKWNTNETLFTLMMNYVATQLVAYFCIFWESPKGSGKIGIINQRSQIGWLPKVADQQYLLNIIVVGVLVLLMFVGACAGSTGGGIKVSRFLLMGKTLGKELKQALHPQVVAPVRMDGKLVNHETIRTTNVFLAAYIFIFAASFMLVSLDGFDMVTNFTSVAATLNNIGPGLNQVGPMMNFGAYSNFAKLVLIFDMLAGRLEIFPMLVLFLPDAWRRF